MKNAVSFVEDETIRDRNSVNIAPAAVRPGLHLSGSRHAESEAAGTYCVLEYFVQMPWGIILPWRSIPDVHAFTTGRP